MKQVSVEQRGRPLDASETGREGGPELPQAWKAAMLQLSQCCGKECRAETAVGTLGRPAGPGPPSGAARGHVLCRARRVPTRLEAQAEGRSEPRMHVRTRARGSRWWHRWNQPRTDGNTGIPEDAKNRARQCPWTIWSHDHLSGRRWGQVITQDNQRQGLQI